LLLFAEVKPLDGVLSWVSADTADPSSSSGEVGVAPYARNIIQRERGNFRIERTTTRFLEKELTMCAMVEKERD
jgi:hypothetical protein